MHNVFIFGAGASKQCGGPLMSEFLDQARGLYHEDPSQPGSAAFKQVFEAIPDLQQIHMKSYLDLDNLEVLFGAIEMAQLLNKLPGRTGEEIPQLRDSLVELIVTTLERSMKFPVIDRRVNPLEPYKRFSHLLRESLTNSLSKSNQLSMSSFAILTFNYDVALDVALHFNGIPFDYCLEEVSEGNDLAYLKLHGSINWGECQECKRIIPYEIKDAKHELFADPKYVHYNLGSILNRKQHHDKPLAASPIIVPPTWNKATHHSQLEAVWRRACKELERAENIFIIGYSLPETDSFFRYLFALGTQGRTQIKRLWVVDPDPHGIVEARVEGFVGQGIRSRLQFFNITFSELTTSSSFRNAINEL